MRSCDPRMLRPATSTIPPPADPTLGAGGRVRSATAPGQQAIVGASVIFRGVVGIKNFFLTAAKHPADEIGLPLDIVLSDVRTLHRNDCQSCGTTLAFQVWRSRRSGASGAGWQQRVH